MYPGLHVVAVVHSSGDSLRAPERLAAALGLTLVEARPRSSGPWPRAVAVAGDAADAERAAAALRAQGFEPLVVPGEQIEGEEQRLRVRSFAFGDEEIRVVMRDQRVWDLPYARIEVMLRGTQHTRAVHTETTRERKLSPGRAALTGGLILTRDVKTENRTVTEQAEGFLDLYTTDGPILTLRERELTYLGLGSAMQPTRMGNFNQVVALLRTCAPDAAFNDRLLTRAGLLQILAGVLAPDPYFDVALALLARCPR